YDCLSCIAIADAQQRAEKALPGLRFRTPVVGRHATTKFVDSCLWPSSPLSTFEAEPCGLRKGPMSSACELSLHGADRPTNLVVSLRSTDDWCAERFQYRADARGARRADGAVQSHWTV